MKGFLFSNGCYFEYSLFIGDTIYRQIAASDMENPA